MNKYARFGLASFGLAAWFAISSLFLLNAINQDYEFVPMLFHEWILWPNTMTFGAVFGVSVLLFFFRVPSFPQLVFAIISGSIVGIFCLWLTTEVEFLMCSLITVVLVATIIQRMVTKRRLSPLNAMTFCIYVIYGSFVLVDHQMFLFPVYDAVQEERVQLITKAAAATNPLEHALCLEENVSCFVFEENDLEGFSVRDKEVLQDVWLHKPYDPAVVTLETLNILNNKTDTTYAAMRHVNGRTFVVLSSPEHLITWRILAAKYLIIWSSTAFLTLFLVMALTGYFLTSHERKS